MENRISRLQCRLEMMRKHCQSGDEYNSLVFEEVISDLTTLIHSLEDERRQIEVEQEMYDRL